MNLIVTAGSQEPKTKRISLAKMAYPGKPAVFSNGTMVSPATGWRRFRDEASESVTRVLDDAALSRTTAASTLSHAMFLCNDIARRIIDIEDMRSHSPSLAQLFAQACAWKDIAEEAQTNVDKELGICIDVNAFSRIKGGQPDDIKKIKERPRVRDTQPTRHSDPPRRT